MNPDPKHQGEIVGDVVFFFTIRDLSVRHRRRIPWGRSYVAQNTVIESDEIIVSYYVGANAGKTFLKKVCLEVPSENIRFEARFSPRSSSENSINFNGVDISKFIKGYDIERVSPKIFAYPFFSTRSKDSPSSAKRLIHHNIVFAEALERLLQAATPNNLGDETILREVRRILAGDNLDFYSLQLYEQQANTKAFKRLYSEIREDPEAEVSRNILALSGMARSFSILEVLDDELSDYFLGVRYIGPARAAGERFYRKQELEVSEISSDGQNISNVSRLTYSNATIAIFRVGGEDIGLPPSSGPV